MKVEQNNNIMTRTTAAANDTGNKHHYNQPISIVIRITQICNNEIHK